MYDEIITLKGASSKTTNSIGDTITTFSQIDVFCKLKSIGQSEFWQAQSAGFKPELKFILNDYRDYNDEKVVVYSGIEYTVLRTYRTGEQLELVVKRGVDE